MTATLYSALWMSGCAALVLWAVAPAFAQDRPTLPTDGAQHKPRDRMKSAP
jgi:hypothetical protein